MEPRHLSLDELNSGLDEILQSPVDGGRIEMLIVRPIADERQTPQMVEVNSDAGVVGDHWSTGEYSDESDVQIAIMNSRVLDLVTGNARERWSLAGDNLIADMNLSQENLVPGQKLEIGSAILEITEVPHKGCSKFSARFGPDALRFVNLGRAAELRLRGVYARVVQPGHITVGDQINKL